MLGMRGTVPVSKKTSALLAKNWICSEFGVWRQGCCLTCEPADNCKGENGGIISIVQVSNAFLSPRKKIFCLWCGSGRISLDRQNTKNPLKLLLLQGSLLPLSDSAGHDLTLVTCLIFHPGTETKVMKLKAQHRSLTFHLPGVGKKGLVLGEGAIGNAPAPNRSPYGGQLERAVRGHRHCPTQKVYGSGRWGDTLMHAAGRHFHF